MRRNTYVRRKKYSIWNRFLAFLLAITLCLLQVNVSYAEETESTTSETEENETQETTTEEPTVVYTTKRTGVTYTLYSDGLYTLTGEGHAINCLGESEKAIVKKIEIGEGIISLQRDCFRSYTALESIEFSSTLETIGQGAFMECTSLTSLVFPKTILEIMPTAFYDCSSLKEVTFLGAVEDMYNAGTGGAAFDAEYIDTVNLSCEIYDTYYDEEIVEWKDPAFEACFGDAYYCNIVEYHQFDPVGELIPIEGTDKYGKKCLVCEQIIEDESESLPGEDYDKLLKRFNVMEVSMGAATLEEGKEYFGFTAPRDDRYTFKSNGIGIMLLHVEEDRFYNTEESNGYNIFMKKGESIVLKGTRVSSTETLRITSVLDEDKGELVDTNSLKNITWYLNTDGVITIYGEGAMPDFDMPAEDNINPDPWFRNDYFPPWTAYNRIIKKVVIEDGITKVGNKAFSSQGYTDEITRTLYSYKFSINEIELADSVMEIGNQAFGDLVDNVVYTIPGHVKKVGSSAFGSYASIVISEGVEVLADSAFGSCTIMQSKLPDSIVEIGERAFYRAEFYEDTVILPKDLKVIQENAFGMCNHLKTVVFPEGLEEIGELAFAWCYELHGLELPDSLKTIGSRAFERCWDLEHVKLNDGLKVIGYHAFGNAGIKRIIIPASVELVDDNAFDNNDTIEIQVEDYPTNYDLEVIVIEEGVKELGNHAFLSSTAGKIVIPKSIENFYHNETQYFPDCNFPSPGSQFSKYQTPTLYLWRDSAADEFFWDPEIIGGGHAEYIVAAGECGENIYYVLTEKGELVLLGEGQIIDFADPTQVPWYEYRDQIKNIEVDWNITGIGSNAFAGCENLQTIYYPALNNELRGKHIYVNDLDYIGKDAFKDCNQFAFKCYFGSETLNYIHKNQLDILVETFESTCGTDSTWVIDNGTLIVSGAGAISDFEKTGAPWYTLRDEVKKIVLDDDITAIGNYAFYGCMNLESVSGAASVTRVGDNAFSGCIQLPQLSLENVKEIGSFAFNGCKKLSTLKVGNSVEILNMSFANNCPLLTSVELPDNLKEIRDNECYTNDSIEFLVNESSNTAELLGLYGISYRDKDIVLVSAIEIRSPETSYNMNQDTVVSLAAVVYPADATNAKLFWSSSDESVATVNDHGEVTLLKAGEVDIIASSTDGSEISSCITITVTDEKIIQEIKLSNDTVEIDKETTPYYVLSVETIPEEIEDEDVIWTISDKSVVKIMDGILIPVGEGTATVKCISKNNAAIYDSCQVTVHSYKFAKTIEPTCEVTGAAIYVCEGCRKEKRTDIKPTGHLWNEEYTIDSFSTCLVNGSKSIHCQTCDAIKPGSSVPLELVQYVSGEAATCTADGMKAYYQFGSNKKYADEECTIDITNIWDIWVILNRTGHKFETYEYNNDATCTQNGTETAKCEHAGCHATDTRIKAGTATGHKAEIMESVLATCTGSGLTEGSYCSRCGVILHEQEIIEEAGHNYDYTTYEWNQDRTECVATRICKSDRAHVETCAASVKTELVESSADVQETNIVAEFSEEWCTDQIIIVLSKTEASTPTPIETPIPTPTPTDTPESVPTGTAMPTETSTPEPVPSDTAEPTETPDPTPTEEVDKSDYKLGDVNRDGQIGLQDAQMALKAALFIIEIDSEQEILTDVNYDGAINLADAQMILKASLKIIVLEDEVVRTEE